MADDSPQKNVRSKEESEIWDAIGAFEKIIEALPNDHISIEALAVAYEQVGDHDRAKHYGVPVEKIKPYPVLDEPDRHDHYGEPDARGWRTVTRVEGRESECPECCEPDDAEGGEQE